MSNGIGYRYVDNSMMRNRVDGWSLLPAQVRLMLIRKACEMLRKQDDVRRAAMSAYEDAVDVLCAPDPVQAEAYATAFAALREQYLALKTAFPASDAYLPERSGLNTSGDKDRMDALREAHRIEQQNLYQANNAAEQKFYAFCEKLVEQQLAQVSVAIRAKLPADVLQELDSF